MLTTIAKGIVRLTPDSVAVSIARAMAARTPRAARSPAEQEAMKSARSLALARDASYVAWQFGTENRTGPLVVLIHGWGGRATQMAALAVSLAAKGFRCVVFDVTGHGDSPVRGTEWRYFLRDIPALAASLNEDVYAFVAHSAGGLTTMAARKLSGLRAQKYVCICTPSHPFPAVRVMRANLNPRPSGMAMWKQYIAEQFSTTWDKLESGEAFSGAGRDLLLCYDERDRYIDHTEGDKLHALCPGSRLIKTNEFGHGRILAAPSIAESIGEFLLDSVSQRDESAVMRA